MRRWEIEVGWRGQIRLTYGYEEWQFAQRMVFELAERTGESVTIRFVEDPPEAEDQPEVEDDIPVD